MTKDDVMLLIDKRLEHIKKEENVFPGNSSYYSGLKRGLLQAKELVGMIGTANTKGDLNERKEKEE